MPPRRSSRAGAEIAPGLRPVLCTTVFTQKQLNVVAGTLVRAVKAGRSSNTFKGAARKERLNESAWQHWVKVEYFDSTGTKETRYADRRNLGEAVEEAPCVVAEAIRHKQVQFQVAKGTGIRILGDASHAKSFREKATKARIPEHEWQYWVTIECCTGDAEPFVRFADRRKLSQVNSEVPNVAKNPGDATLDNPGDAVAGAHGDAATDAPGDAAAKPKQKATSAKNPKSDAPEKNGQVKASHVAEISPADSSSAATFVVTVTTTHYEESTFRMEKGTHVQYLQDASGVDTFKKKAKKADVPKSEWAMWVQVQIPGTTSSGRPAKFYIHKQYLTPLEVAKPSLDETPSKKKKSKKSKRSKKEKKGDSEEEEEKVESSADAMPQSLDHGLADQPMITPTTANSGEPNMPVPVIGSMLTVIRDTVGDDAGEDLRANCNDQVVLLQINTHDRWYVTHLPTGKQGFVNPGFLAAVPVARDRPTPKTATPIINVPERITQSLATASLDEGTGMTSPETSLASSSLSREDALPDPGRFASPVNVGGVNQFSTKQILHRTGIFAPQVDMRQLSTTSAVLILPGPTKIRNSGEWEIKVGELTDQSSKAPLELHSKETISTIEQQYALTGLRPGATYHISLHLAGSSQKPTDLTFLQIGEIAISHPSKTSTKFHLPAVDKKRVKKYKVSCYTLDDSIGTTPVWSEQFRATRKEVTCDELEVGKSYQIIVEILGSDNSVVAELRQVFCKVGELIVEYHSADKATVTLPVSDHNLVTQWHVRWSEAGGAGQTTLKVAKVQEQYIIIEELVKGKKYDVELSAAGPPCVTEVRKQYTHSSVTKDIGAISFKQTSATSSNIRLSNSAQYSPGTNYWVVLISKINESLQPIPGTEREVNMYVKSRSLQIDNLEPGATYNLVVKAAHRGIASSSIIFMQLGNCTATYIAAGLQVTMPTCDRNIANGFTLTLSTGQGAHQASIPLRSLSQPYTIPSPRLSAGANEITLSPNLAHGHQNILWTPARLSYQHQKAHGAGYRAAEQRVIQFSDSVIATEEIMGDDGEVLATKGDEVKVLREVAQGMFEIRNGAGHKTRVFPSSLQQRKPRVHDVRSSPSGNIVTQNTFGTDWVSYGSKKAEVAPQTSFSAQQALSGFLTSVVGFFSNNRANNLAHYLDDLDKNKTPVDFDRVAAIISQGNAADMLLLFKITVSFTKQCSCNPVNFCVAVVILTSILAKSPAYVHYTDFSNFLSELNTFAAQYMKPRFVEDMLGDVPRPTRLAEQLQDWQNRSRISLHATVIQQLTPRCTSGTCDLILCLIAMDWWLSLQSLQRGSHHGPAGRGWEKYFEPLVWRDPIVNACHFLDKLNSITVTFPMTMTCELNIAALLQLVERLFPTYKQLDEKSPLSMWNTFGTFVPGDDNTRVWMAELFDFIMIRNTQNHIKVLAWMLEVAPTCITPAMAKRTFPKIAYGLTFQQAIVSVDSQISQFVSSIRGNTASPGQAKAIHMVGNTFVETFCRERQLTPDVHTLSKALSELPLYSCAVAVTTSVFKADVNVVLPDRNIVSSLAALLDKYSSLDIGGCGQFVSSNLSAMLYTIKGLLRHHLPSLAKFVSSSELMWRKDMEVKAVNFNLFNEFQQGSMQTATQVRDEAVVVMSIMAANGRNINPTCGAYFFWKAYCQRINIHIMKLLIGPDKPLAAGILCELPEQNVDCRSPALEAMIYDAVLDAFKEEGMFSPLHLHPCVYKMIAMGYRALSISRADGWLKDDVPTIVAAVKDIEQTHRSIREHDYTEEKYADFQAVWTPLNNLFKNLQQPMLGGIHGFEGIIDEVLRSKSLLTWLASQEVDPASQILSEIIKATTGGAKPTLKALRNLKRSIRQEITCHLDLKVSNECSATFVEFIHHFSSRNSLLFQRQTEIKGDQMSLEEYTWTTLIHNKISMADKFFRSLLKGTVEYGDFRQYSDLLSSKEDAISDEIEVLTGFDPYKQLTDAGGGELIEEIKQALLIIKWITSEDISHIVSAFGMIQDETDGQVICEDDTDFLHLQSIGDEINEYISIRKLASKHHRLTELLSVLDPCHFEFFREISIGNCSQIIGFFRQENYFSPSGYEDFSAKVENLNMLIHDDPANAAIVEATIAARRMLAPLLAPWHDSEKQGKPLKDVFKDLTSVAVSAQCLETCNAQFELVATLFNKATESMMRSAANQVEKLNRGAEVVVVLKGDTVGNITFEISEVPTNSNDAAKSGNRERIDNRMLKEFEVNLQYLSSYDPTPDEKNDCGAGKDAAVASIMETAKMFTEKLSAALELITCLHMLESLGHPLFQASEWRYPLDMDVLKLEIGQLCKIRHDWEDILMSCRQSCKLLALFSNAEIAAMVGDILPRNLREGQPNLVGLCGRRQNVNFASVDQQTSKHLGVQNYFRLLQHVASSRQGADVNDLITVYQEDVNKFTDVIKLLARVLTETFTVKESVERGTQGKQIVCCARNGSEMTQAICLAAEIFLNVYKVVPCCSQVLICDEQTAVDDLDTFFDRIYGFAEMDYVVVGVDLLSYDCRVKLLQKQKELRAKHLEFSNSATVYYICNQERSCQSWPGEYVEVRSNFGSAFRKEVDELKSAFDQLKQKDGGMFPVCKAIIGPAGCGKSHFIKQTIGDGSVISITDVPDSENWLEKLIALGTQAKVYFNISGNADPHYVNQVFFELLFCRSLRIRSHNRSFLMPNDLQWEFYIEIPSEDPFANEQALQTNARNLFPVICVASEACHINSSSHNFQITIPSPASAILDSSSLEKIVSAVHYYGQEDARQVDGQMMILDAAENLQTELQNKSHFTRLLEILFSKTNRAAHAETRWLRTQEVAFLRYFLDRIKLFDTETFDVAKKYLFANCTRFLLEQFVKESEYLCQKELVCSWQKCPIPLLFVDPTGVSFNTMTSETARAKMYPMEGAVLKYFPHPPPNEEKPEFVALRRIRRDPETWARFFSFRSADELLSAVDNRKELDCLKCLQWKFGLMSDKNNIVETLLNNDGFVLTWDFTYKLLLVDERQRSKLPLIMVGETGVGKTFLLEMYTKLLNCRNLYSPELETSLLLTRRTCTWLKSLTVDWSGKLTEDFQSWFPMGALLAAGDKPPMELANSIAGRVDQGAATAEELGDIIERLVSEGSLTDEQDVADLVTELKGYITMCLEKYTILKPMDDQFTSLINRDDLSPAQCRVIMMKLVNADPQALFFKKLIDPGTSRQDIEKFLSEARNLARRCLNYTVVVFFDEVNTSSCLGVFKDILVDRMFGGENLEENIFFTAAINPPPKKSVQGENLDDEVHRVEYNVHPLPRVMDEMKWIYEGISDDTQLNEYIEKKIMLQQALLNSSHSSFPPTVLLEFKRIMMRAHTYCREFIGVNSVSQRDIQRLFLLVPFFWLVNKNVVLLAERAGRFMASDPGTDLQKCVFLSIAVVYYFRLVVANKSARASRQDFAHYIHLSDPAAFHQGDHKRCPHCGPNSINNDDLSAFQKIVNYAVDEVVTRGHFRFDQKVALTDALKENILCTVACVQTGIPLGIIGQPGTSKTLSWMIVKENLRGINSPKLFCKQFSAIDPFPYQGSAQSKTEEISRCFENAAARQVFYDESQHTRQKETQDNYSATRNDDDAPDDGEIYMFKQSTKCVVFLDEAGLLSENDMVLKVLHRYLDERKVSFIALSNRRFDPANANRMATVYRSPAALSELFTLALGCIKKGDDRRRDSNATPDELLDENIHEEQYASAEERKFLLALCHGYLQLTKLSYDNVNLGKTFHHRDFIYMLRNLLRRLSRPGLPISSQVSDFIEALEENFGGCNDLVFERIADTFLRNMKQYLPRFPESLSSANAPKPRGPIQTLLSIQDDLATVKDSTSVYSTGHDLASRFRMIIDPTDNFSSVDIMFQLNILSPDDCEVIHMSTFQGDQDELYVAEVVARIRRSLDRAKTVVLVGADRVYGSLYELLNLSFRKIQDKKYVNITLGRHLYACPVDPGFQCVVVLKESRLKKTAAPFLSRFAKFRLSPDDALRQMHTWLSPDTGNHNLWRVVDEQCRDFVEVMLSRNFLGLDKGSGFLCLLLSCFHRSGPGDKPMLSFYTNLTQAAERLVPDNHVAPAQRSVRGICARLLQLMPPEHFIMMFKRIKERELYYKLYFDTLRHFEFRRTVVEFAQSMPDTTIEEQHLIHCNKFVAFLKHSSAVTQLATDKKEFFDTDAECIAVADANGFKKQLDADKFFDDFAASDQKNCALILVDVSQASGGFKHVAFLKWLVDSWDIQMRKKNKRKCFFLVLYSQLFLASAGHKIPAFFLNGWDTLYFDLPAAGDMLLMNLKAISKAFAAQSIQDGRNDEDEEVGIQAVLQEGILKQKSSLVQQFCQKVATEPVTRRAEIETAGVDHDREQPHLGNEFENADDVESDGEDPDNDDRESDIGDDEDDTDATGDGDTDATGDGDTDRAHCIGDGDVDVPPELLALYHSNSSPRKLNDAVISILDKYPEVLKHAGTLLSEFFTQTTAVKLMEDLAAHVAEWDSFVSFSLLVELHMNPRLESILTKLLLYLCKDKTIANIVNLGFSGELLSRLLWFIPRLTEQDEEAYRSNALAINRSIVAGNKLPFYGLIKQRIELHSHQLKILGDPNACFKLHNRLVADAIVKRFLGCEQRYIDLYLQELVKEKCKWSGSSTDAREMLGIAVSYLKRKRSSVLARSTSPDKTECDIVPFAHAYLVHADTRFEIMMLLYGMQAMKQLSSWEGFSTVRTLLDDKDATISAKECIERFAEALFNGLWKSLLAIETLLDAASMAEEVQRWRQSFRYIRVFWSPNQEHEGNADPEDILQCIMNTICQQFSRELNLMDEVFVILHNKQISENPPVLHAVLHTAQKLLTADGFDTVDNIKEFSTTLQDTQVCAADDIKSTCLQLLILLVKSLKNSIERSKTKLAFLFTVINNSDAKFPHLLPQQSINLFLFVMKRFKQPVKKTAEGVDKVIQDTLSRHHGYQQLRDYCKSVENPIDTLYLPPAIPRRAREIGPNHEAICELFDQPIVHAYYNFIYRMNKVKMHSILDCVRLTTPLTLANRKSPHVACLIIKLAANVRLAFECVAESIEHEDPRNILSAVHDLSTHYLQEGKLFWKQFLASRICTSEKAKTVVETFPEGLRNLCLAELGEGGRTGVELIFTCRVLPPGNENLAELHRSYQDFSGLFDRSIAANDGLQGIAQWHRSQTSEGAPPLVAGLLPKNCADMFVFLKVYKSCYEAGHMDALREVCETLTGSDRLTRSLKFLQQGPPIRTQTLQCMFPEGDHPQDSTVGVELRHLLMNTLAVFLGIGSEKLHYANYLFNPASLEGTYLFGAHRGQQCRLCPFHVDCCLVFDDQGMPEDDGGGCCLGLVGNYINTAITFSAFLLLGLLYQEKAEAMFNLLLSPYVINPEQRQYATFKERALEFCAIRVATPLHSIDEADGYHFSHQEYCTAVLMVFEQMLRQFLRNSPLPYRPAYSSRPDRSCAEKLAQDEAFSQVLPLLDNARRNVNISDPMVTELRSCNSSDITMRSLLGAAVQHHATTKNLPVLKAILSGTTSWRLLHHAKDIFRLYAAAHVFLEGKITRETVFQEQLSLHAVCTSNSADIVDARFAKLKSAYLSGKKAFNQFWHDNEGQVNIGACQRENTIAKIHPEDDEDAGTTSLIYILDEGGDEHGVLGNVLQAILSQQEEFIRKCEEWKCTSTPADVYHHDLMAGEFNQPIAMTANGEGLMTFDEDEALHIARMHSYVTEGNTVSFDLEAIQSYYIQQFVTKAKLIDLEQSLAPFVFKQTDATPLQVLQVKPLTKLVTNDDNFGEVLSGDLLDRVQQAFQQQQQHYNESLELIDHLVNISSAISKQRMQVDMVKNVSLREFTHTNMDSFTTPESFVRFCTSVDMEVALCYICHLYRLLEDRLTSGIHLLMHVPHLLQRPLGEDIDKEVNEAFESYRQEHFERVPIQELIENADSAYTTLQQCVDHITGLEEDLLSFLLKLDLVTDDKDILAYLPQTVKCYHLQSIMVKIIQHGRQVRHEQSESRSADPVIKVWSEDNTEDFVIVPAFDEEPAESHESGFSEQSTSDEDDDSLLDFAMFAELPTDNSDNMFTDSDRPLEEEFVIVPAGDVKGESSLADDPIVPARATSENETDDRVESSNTHHISEIIDPKARKDAEDAEDSDKSSEYETPEESMDDKQSDSGSENEESWSVVSGNRVTLLKRPSSKESTDESSSEPDSNGDSDSDGDSSSDGGSSREESDEDREETDLEEESEGSGDGTEVDSDTSSGEASESDDETTDGSSTCGSESDLEESREIDSDDDEADEESGNDKCNVDSTRPTAHTDHGDEHADAKLPTLDHPEVHAGLEAVMVPMASALLTCNTSAVHEPESIAVKQIPSLDSDPTVNATLSSSVTSSVCGQREIPYVQLAQRMMAQVQPKGLFTPAPKFAKYRFLLQEEVLKEGFTSLKKFTEETFRTHAKLSSGKFELANSQGLLIPPGMDVAVDPQEGRRIVHVVLPESIVTVNILNLTDGASDCLQRIRVAKTAMCSLLCLFVMQTLQKASSETAQPAGLFDTNYCLVSEGDLTVEDICHGTSEVNLYFAVGQKYKVVDICFGEDGNIYQSVFSDKLAQHSSLVVPEDQSLCPNPSTVHLCHDDRTPVYKLPHHCVTSLSVQISSSTVAELTIPTFTPVGLIRCQLQLHLGSESEVAVLCQSGNPLPDCILIQHLLPPTVEFKTDPPDFSLMTDSLQNVQVDLSPYQAYSSRTPRIVNVTPVRSVADILTNICTELNEPPGEASLMNVLWNVALELQAPLPQFWALVQQPVLQLLPSRRLQKVAIRVNNPDASIAPKTIDISVNRECTVHQLRLALLHNSLCQGLFQSELPVMLSAGPVMLGEGTVIADVKLCDDFSLQLSTVAEIKENTLLFSLHLRRDGDDDEASTENTPIMVKLGKSRGAKLLVEFVADCLLQCRHDLCQVIMPNDVLVTCGTSETLSECVAMCSPSELTDLSTANVVPCSVKQILPALDLMVTIRPQNASTDPTELSLPPSMTLQELKSLSVTTLELPEHDSVVLKDTSMEDIDLDEATLQDLVENGMDLSFVILSPTSSLDPSLAQSAADSHAMVASAALTVTIRKQSSSTDPAELSLPPSTTLQELKSLSVTTLELPEHDSVVLKDTSMEDIDLDEATLQDLVESGMDLSFVILSPTSSLDPSLAQSAADSHAMAASAALTVTIRKQSSSTDPTELSLPPSTTLQELKSLSVTTLELPEHDSVVLKDTSMEDIDLDDATLQDLAESGMDLSFVILSHTSSSDPSRAQIVTASSDEQNLVTVSFERKGKKDTRQSLTLAGTTSLVDFANQAASLLCPESTCSQLYCEEEPVDISESQTMEDLLGSFEEGKDALFQLDMKET